MPGIIDFKLFGFILIDKSKNSANKSLKRNPVTKRNNYNSIHWLVGWLVGFTTCQPLLIFSILKHFCFIHSLWDIVLTVKVTYLGIRSAHERVWLVERKPIWLPWAYLTRGDLEPARGNLHLWIMLILYYLIMLNSLIWKI